MGQHPQGDAHESHRRHRADGNVEVARHSDRVVDDLVELPAALDDATAAGEHEGNHGQDVNTPKAPTLQLASGTLSAVRGTKLHL
jgi:hypothetical protein